MTNETVGLCRIVSGGQTGVDRAALDAAIELNYEHGGWCPLGRLAEDGAIPARYHLQETDAADYPIRTELNVVDSDGTLILFRRQMTGGTKLTHRLARKHNKPCLSVDLDSAAPPDVQQWITAHRIQTLNVAGPRESSAPGIEAEARRWLLGWLNPAS